MDSSRRCQVLAPPLRARGCPALLTSDGRNL